MLQNRNGFLNILSSAMAKMHLECRVQGRKMCSDVYILYPNPRLSALCLKFHALETTHTTIFKHLARISLKNRGRLKASAEKYTK